MRVFLRGLSLAFFAGCVGAMISGLSVWGQAEAGITKQFGIKIAPHLTADWLCPRIVWGGLWGLLFMLPVLRGSFFLRGALYSLAPAIAQLFFSFSRSHMLVFGFTSGHLTPAFVVFMNLIWGLGAALWLKITEDS